MCAVYNITASRYRRDRHLRVNALVYSMAVIWEFKQTLHHLKSIDAAARCQDSVSVEPELEPAA
jgi:hypothetical protein